MKNILLFISILLIGTVSFAQTHFDEKKVGHAYYLSVPDYMTETKELNESASLQYQNILKEAYTIVIEDSKAELNKLGMAFTGPKDFYDYFAKDFFNNEDKMSKIKDVGVNGNKAVQIEVSRKFNDLDIIYLVTVVETKTHYYKILSWTLTEHWKDLSDDFRKIAVSLKD